MIFIKKNFLFFFMISCMLGCSSNFKNYIPFFSTTNSQNEISLENNNNNEVEEASDAIFSDHTSTDNDSADKPEDSYQIQINSSNEVEEASNTIFSDHNTITDNYSAESEESHPPEESHHMDTFEDVPPNTNINDIDEHITSEKNSQTAFDDHKQIIISPTETSKVINENLQNQEGLERITSTSDSFEQTNEEIFPEDNRQKTKITYDNTEQTNSNYIINEKGLYQKNNDEDPLKEYPGEHSAEAPTTVCDGERITKHWNNLKKVVVIADALNIRNAHGSNKKVIGVANHCEQLLVIDKRVERLKGNRRFKTRGWLKVKTQSGIIGWVASWHTRYLDN